LFSLVQFISASRPITEYFIRNTGTGSDGRSCHLRHCPNNFTQNNKIQMKHHSKKNKKNIHSKDSHSAGDNCPRLLPCLRAWAEPSPGSLPLGAFMFVQGARHYENLYWIHNRNSICRLCKL